jgi:hypothetical protein
LFNDDNKSGGNKLRTYRKLKTQFDLENYLCADVNKKSVSTFVKIRISNNNLNIEKGRYLNTPAEDRICKLCNSGVEDELLFTIICSKLQSCREEFFKDICDVVPLFINMSDFDKFKFIFSSNDLDICKMCILGVNKLYSLNQSKKQD